MTTLLDLPLDILRYLAAENLGPADVFNFGRTSKFVYENVSKNKAVWWRLVERYVTSYPQLIGTLKSEQKDPQTLVREVCHVNPSGATSAISHGYEKYLFNNWDALDADVEWKYEIERVMDEAALIGRVDIYAALLYRYKRDPSRNFSAVIESKSFEMIKFFWEQCRKDPVNRHCIDGMFVTIFTRKPHPEVFPIIEYLREQGSTLTGSDIFQQTPMSCALRCSVVYVKYLVEEGIILPPNPLDEVIRGFNGTAEEQLAVIRYLVEDLQVKPGSYTVTINTHMENIPYLMEHGAVLEGLEYILNAALRQRKVSTVEFLLDQNVPLPNDYYLIFSQRYNIDCDVPTYNLLQALVKRGIDFSKYDPCQLGPLSQQYFRSLYP